MKQYWQRIAIRIDAFSLRERAAIFAAAALILLTLVNQLALDPMSQRQRRLSEQIRQDQEKIATIQAQIQESARAQASDPDAAKRERLQTLERQSNQLQDELKTLHSGLVAPNEMPTLLERILKRHGKLRLVSLKTLPPQDLSAPPTAEGKETPSAGPVQAQAVYKHGVEIVVQGAYLDMLGYMSELEAMRGQLFWAQARLQAENYPDASLSLTLYTLSLEKKWLNM
jgi:MSHA biogenesis protein MshJ